MNAIWHQELNIIFDAEGYINVISNAFQTLIHPKQVNNLFEILVEVYDNHFKIISKDLLKLLLVQDKEWSGFLGIQLHDETIDYLKVQIREIEGSEGLFNCIGIDITQVFRERTSSVRDSFYLQLAQKELHMGIFLYSPVTKELKWDDRAFEILGYEPQSFTPTFATLANHMSREVTIKFNEALNKTLNDYVPFSLTNPFIKVNEEEGTFNLKGDLYLDSQGEPKYIYGIITDISEKVKKEKDLRENQAKLEETLESLQHSQSSLEAADKMSSLGLLVAGVAHEINTPLSSLNASIENVKDISVKVFELFPNFFNNTSASYIADFLNVLNSINFDPELLNSREKRKLKRLHKNTLEDAGIESGSELAEIFVGLGIKDLTPYLAFAMTEDGTRALRFLDTLNEIRRTTDTMEDAIKRVKTIALSLKNYSRSSHKDEFIATDIVENIEMVLVLFQNKLKVGIEVIKNFPENVPLIPTIEDKIAQVWTNLIHNAIQAMEGKGTLTISIALTESDLIVDIQDSGNGIPEESLNKIFNAFYTTKPKGEGTGLGLEIVSRIVQKHHATITVKSKPGETVFSVKLPMQMVDSSVENAKT